jgi:energy-converting hydrogenase B subunit D
MEWELLSDIVQIVIPILIIIGAIVAVFLRDLLGAAIAVAAMSLLLSLEFYILQAPDVAIAEAGVGACLTTAILVIAVRGTKRTEDEL